jgi:hypothetical protein
MVGAEAERSTSPPPTNEKVVPALVQQAVGTENSQMSAEERRPSPTPATMPEKPEETLAEDEATAEAGIVDITSILGAPTITIFGSTL